VKLTWLDHSAFRIEACAAKILIDPFLSDNPSRDNGWTRLPYRQEFDTGR
jgi:L-ascorbate metabolism protein UlaG (beta-lactamase superfamily)